MWPIDRTLSGVTLPSQSGPGSNGIEGVIHIPQNLSITGVSPSDCLVSSRWGGILPLCKDLVSVFYSPNWLDC